MSIRIACVMVNYLVLVKDIDTRPKSRDGVLLGDASA
jgi:hypothetical protein